MKIKKNIKLILKESYKWRNRDLLVGKEFKNPELNKLSLLKSNIFLFSFSVIISIFFGYFFNPELAGYIITALSIFIGLFTSVLILIFDKFVNNTLLNKKNLPDSTVLNLKRTKNFSKKFVFISLEALILAVSMIVLFLLPLMFEDKFIINLLDYTFIYSNISFDDILRFFFNSIILIARILLVMFIIKFFNFLFLIFGLLGSYMKGVFDKKVKI